jgi:hypothetical protein
LNITVRVAHKRHFSKFKLTEVTEANNYLTQMMDIGKDLNKHEITQTLNLEKLAADFLKKKRQEKITNILSITFTSSKYHYYIKFLLCLTFKNRASYI